MAAPTVTVRPTPTAQPRPRSDVPHFAYDLSVNFKAYGRLLAGSAPTAGRC